VTTALVMGHPSAASAVVFIFSSTMAEICSGAKLRFSPGTASTSMTGLPPAPSEQAKGKRLISSPHSSNWRPMMRLMLNSVFLGFMAAWRMAGSPTRRLPSESQDTQEGVVRSPSALVSTSTSPLRQTATHEYVVPRSMPMTYLSPPARPPAAASACALFTAASTSRFLAALASARPSAIWVLDGSTVRPVVYALMAPARSPDLNLARPRRLYPLAHLGAIATQRSASSTARSNWFSDA